MKNPYLLLLVTILSGVSIASAQQAQAQGFKIKKDQLDKVEYYKAPRQIQILDNRPRIRDFREPEVNQQYIINVPPAPAAVAQTQVINVPGVQGSGGTMMNVPNLPQSGFGSNIPSGGTLKPGGLASGNSTNRLLGTYKPPAAAKPTPAKLPVKSPRPGQILIAQPPTVMVVPRPSSGAVSGGMNSSAEVHGTVQKRSLLGQKN